MVGEIDEMEDRIAAMALPFFDTFRNGQLSGAEIS